MAIRVLVWNEGRHEKEMEQVRSIYQKGIHNALADFLRAPDVEVRTATLDDPACGLTEEAVGWADVMLWWAHAHHDEVPDEAAVRVQRAVQRGMGFIALHSAHLAKPFRLLMGTSCTLRWREGDRERLWCANPAHPIAQGLPEHFELPEEEMYGEFFDVPQPDETVFLGWFAGGELFRSGIAYRRGYGKVFYFQPGHETCPTYYDPHIQRVLQNAVRWAAPAVKRPELTCPNAEPLESAHRG